MPMSRIENAALVPPPQPTVTRLRTVARTGPSFGEVLRGGLGLIMSGAGAVMGAAGGPLLSSAVRATQAGAGGAGAAETTAAGSSDKDMLKDMKELQQQSFEMNVELLKLQEAVQQENRRFSTASNVLKARHDTARAAIGNIRSS